jgi:hypothetical protein
VSIDIAYKVCRLFSYISVCVIIPLCKHLPWWEYGSNQSSKADELCVKSQSQRPTYLKQNADLEQAH